MHPAKMGVYEHHTLLAQMLNEPEHHIAIIVFGSTGANKQIFTSLDLRDCIKNQAELVI